MRKRFLILMVGTPLVLLILVILKANVWAPLIARFLVVNESPRKSDMIIIPSGTADADRIRYGAELYKKGFAPKVLLSGSSYLWNETRIDLMKIYTMSLGVSEKDIWVDHDSGSTVENAHFAKEIAIKNGCRSVLITTSPTHSRRTKMVFRKIFPKEIPVTVSCGPSNFVLEKWWKKPAMAREVSYEYFVFLYYGLFGF